MQDPGDEEEEEDLQDEEDEEEEEDTVRGRYQHTIMPSRIVHSCSDC